MSLSESSANLSPKAEDIPPPADKSASSLSIEVESSSSSNGKAGGSQGSDGSGTERFIKKSPIDVGEKESSPSVNAGEGEHENQGVRSVSFVEDRSIFVEEKRNSDPEKRSASLRSVASEVRTNLRRIRRVSPAHTYIFLLFNVFQMF